jgi:heme/copper-type cytochrome/quinol oxidase subunit 4
VVIELAITVFIGLSGLGQWTVRYAAVLTVLYLVRAAIGDLLLADPADPRAGETEGRMASLLGLVLMIGFISLLAFSAAAALTGDPSWLVVGLTIPLALAQDLLRYISFWTLHPKTAAILDLVWLLTSLVGIGVIATTRSVTVGIAF